LIFLSEIGTQGSRESLCAASNRTALRGHDRPHTFARVAIGFMTDEGLTPASSVFSFNREV
jgi:hypothetical protein